MRRSGSLLALALLATACAVGDGAPPAVSVSHGAVRLELEPISWCSDSGCADGSPVDTTATLGAVADEIEVHYEEGWQFWADVVLDGRTQGPSLTVVDRGAGEWSIAAPDVPGRHRVDLVGLGDGSDLAVSFWVEIGEPAE